VAQKLGYEANQITWKEAVSAQRENLLQTGQVDMIFATYSITDQRMEKVGFAGPYFVAGQSFLVAKGNPKQISGPESLNGQRLCSVVGSTPAQRIKDEYSKDVQLQEYDTYSSCMEALAAGKIDAMTTDDVILAGFAADPAYKGKVELVGTPFSEERYGVGLPKDNKETCEKVNIALKELIESGAWEAAVAQNLGADFEPNAKANPPASFVGCS
jgi:glutamate transport system substrate-binding protein